MASLLTSLQAMSDTHILFFFPCLQARMELWLVSRYCSTPGHHLQRLGRATAQCELQYKLLD